MDNAGNNRTNKVTKIIKEINLIFFTISPYIQELNKVENTFYILKDKLSLEILSIKQLKECGNRRDKNLQKTNI